MLLPKIKDLHFLITNFLQMIYTSSISLRDYYLDWKLNSLSNILPIFPSNESIDKENPILFILKTMIFMVLKIQDFIVYLFSFKWLALSDFAYLNVSVPENFWKSLPKVPPMYEYSNWIFLMFQKATRFLDMLEEKIGYTLLSKIPKDPFFYEDYNYIKYPQNLDKTNMVFFDSYQTISNLPKTLLEPSWFDSISTPMQIFGGIDSEQLHKTANEYGFFSQSNLGLLCFLIFPMAISIFFSSFLNSFLINLPLSISRIVSLRYFNINSPYYDSDITKWETSVKKKKFSFGFPGINIFTYPVSIFQLISGQVSWATLQTNISLLSVLGIVLGEICFIFLLILPPPFIQFTLSYLDSIWPYIFGLSLIVLVISEGVKTNIVTLWTDVETRNVRFNIKRKSLQVFLSCFFLSLTEQSCCFSYFGSLNLNSTANFFDTYIFSASISPIIFIFSCLGFLLGSVIAISIYNFCLSQLLYFVFFGWKQKNKILSFIFSYFFKYYNFLKSKLINWWNFPNLNLSFIFQFHWLDLSLFYKMIHLVRKFLNIFSVINWYFASLFNLLINKITGDKQISATQLSFFRQERNEEKKNARNISLESEAFGFGNGLLNLSVYPPFSSTDEILGKNLKKQPTVQDYFGLLKKNKPFNWYILTGIDQFLVICLVIFSFTTIPFYSMDFMVNKVFGFIPQDQILNNYNLNNAMFDYGENIGKIGNIKYTDSPNQKDDIRALLHETALFDQNNYGNVIWKTNFENLNYRNALHFSNFLQDYDRQKTRKKLFAPTMRKLRNKLFPYYQGLKYNSTKREELIKNGKLIQAKKNIFLVDPKDFLNDNLRKKNIKNFQEAFSVISSKVLNSDPNGFRRWSRYWGERIIIDDPIQYTSDVTFCPSALDEFRSGISNYQVQGDFFKKPFAYKYFHNPISKIILSNDLKNFLKHQPLSQQLTDVQEKDLALLRVKMAHYYDSLRFYFNLKNNVHQLKNSFEHGANLMSDFSLSSNLKQNNQQTNRFYKNLQLPPMIAKSISSLNYHQQFKGTYQVVRELYDISLYNNNKNNNNIFPEQIPKSETFFENFSDTETPELNTTANETQNYSSETINLPSRGSLAEKQLSKNFALPINNFDKQAEASYKSTHTNSAFNISGDSIYQTESKISLKKIKEATLGITDSLISRVTNRLYQIDPDLVTNSTKNFLPSNGWLADRKALLSYDKSLFNEYDYNEENFLHEEAKIINSNKSFEQQEDTSSTFLPKDFIKMNKKIKESTNPFYIGWDKNLRKFILTSRLIHRPYYLTQANSIENSENLPFNHELNQKNVNTKQTSNQSVKPQMTEYYSSWPFMGDKITSVKSNKYSGLYTNRRFISDNPKTKPGTGKNLQTYYYENFPYIALLPYELVQDYTENFDYYYYKNYNSIKQIFPRLYMPSNILKYYSRLTNYKQTMLTPTSSTFLWSGTEDISSNYPIALLVNIEQKLLGYETLYLDQKIKERQKYRINNFQNNQEINFNSHNYTFNAYIKLFRKLFRTNFPRTWYKILDYQNHITRNFEINEEIEGLFWYNYENIINYNRSLFFTEYLYPREIEEDFFVIPNNEYPTKLRYTLGEIRTIQQGYDDGIEYSDDHKIPSTIERTSKPNIDF